MGLLADEIMDVSVKQHDDRAFLQSMELGILLVATILAFVLRSFDYSSAYSAIMFLIAFYLIFSILSVLNRISMQLANHHVIHLNILRRLEEEKQKK